MGLCCAVLTFDQPLYLRSYKIKHSKALDFQKMVLRVGGFHQLMSFLGAGCKLMENSGLEDLWATVYAKNSIPKMMEGRSYSKTLRACLLTEAALSITMLTSDNNNNTDTSLEDTEQNSDKSINNERETVNSADVDIACSSKSLPDSRSYTFQSRSVPDDYKDLFIELKQLLDELYVTSTLSSTEAEQNLTLMEFCTKIHELKLHYSNCRTAKLWLMLMHIVATARMFIRAERIGNWQLHLKTSQDMLPYFSAAGHNNYAKSCRLYLQDCENLCRCVKTSFENGQFTVRRSEKFWSGTWTDMTIEQSLMRSGKTHGGLINITHKEAAKAKWLLSAHIVAEYSDALRLMTGIYAQCFFSVGTHGN